MLLFFSAFGLGLALFATPGAITAQLLRGLGQRGFLSALLLQLGALLVLILWALIALVGVTFFAQNLFIRVLLGVAGTLLLLWLAWLALRDAYHGKSGEAKTASAHGDFVLGAALTLVNPFPVVFWLSVLPTLVVVGQVSRELQEAMVFFAGFLISALLWSIFMASLIAWGRRLVTPIFFRLVNLICGLVLGFFALKMLLSTFLLLKI